MLILTRNPSQSIIIGNKEIKISHLKVTYDEFGPIVTIGIDADRATKVSKGPTNHYIRAEAIRMRNEYKASILAKYGEPIE